MAGECEECRKKRLKLQRHSANGTEPAAVPPIVHEVLRAPGLPLDANTRAFFEPRFGHDFGQVRVHTDARAAESAEAMNALAYTVGQDVIFKNGRYAPEAFEGKRLLAHELAHVVQQQMVRATVAPQVEQKVSHSGDATEREADTVAAKVIAGDSIRVKQQASGDAIARQGAGGRARSHRFSAEGVSVVVRPSCSPAEFGFVTVEEETRAALDRIFNSDCIEESRRTRIQRNLTSHGLDIRCARSRDLQDPARCAEATGFFIPANIMTLGSKSFPNHPDFDPGCVQRAFILHEIIHLTRGVFAEGLPGACQMSCFGVASAGAKSADLCRNIDVFGRRRPPLGDFPLPPEDRRVV